MNQIDLDGKIAVITGGAQGIGSSIAERFIESGAKVRIWDLNQDLAYETSKRLGVNAEAIRVDITCPKQIAEAASNLIKHDGNIDILVNNAGISGPNAPVHEYPVDDWRHVIEVDLNGTFFCCRAVTPYMIAAGYGRIVNVASIAGKEGNPNASAYSSAKAGMIALTKSLGKELSDFNISVNAITPAAAHTAIFDQMTEEHIKYMLSKIPRGRFVSVQEIASMVVWLASEENSFSTGAVFDLSGGRATY
ncbi:MAG: 3-oxoacyl-ACP reductase [Rhodospirillales bacterium]|nr:3-oxoacyl-ACP reductase [Rhodospirillales bacterium]